MANRICQRFYTTALGFTPRKGGLYRGKPPGIAKTLKQRMEELNYKDPAIYYKVDIGLPQDKNLLKRLNSEWKKETVKNKRNKDLEKQAFHRELKVDYDQIYQDWQQSKAPQHLKTIAEHYGVFNDLFGDAYFYPTVPLTVQYDFGHEDYLAGVFNGNVLKPRDLQNAPNVYYDAADDSFWTLIMTTPDGNLSSSDNEYCHWLITNIPGNNIKKGEQLVDYMRPIPCRGIGYCRYIFVLYKQDKKIDFSEYKKKTPCLDLVQRNWNTYNFYRKYQDCITPAGLSFFQSDWDDTLIDFFHNTLNMKEPMFEYDFPSPFIAKEKWFPKKEAFDLYLDMYRDPKQINKEYLVKKLQKTHPFDGPEPPLKYPNAQIIDNRVVPSWLRERMIKDRMKWGRINEIE